MTAARLQSERDEVALSRLAPEQRDQLRSEIHRLNPADVPRTKLQPRVVLLSRRNLFDDETHEVARARARWCRPTAPVIRGVPERDRAGE